ncbi:MAG TPA: hypothetical protein VJ729_14820 [Nitrososphaeraceae archaeon]|nr:hypothetical protein [Nitrososphaeraceae archaeon]
MTYTINWFKCESLFYDYDERYSRHIYDDSGACGCLFGNNYAYNISLPKTTIQLRETSFFSKELKENQKHYYKLNNHVFKHLVEYNDSILDNIFDDYVYNNWQSFELNYNLSLIEQVEVYGNALNHIEERIPSFKNEIVNIQKNVLELNQMVAETRDLIKSKTSNALNKFNILYENGSPMILHKLQSYWFDILYDYRNKNKWYNDILLELKPFYDELKEEGNYVRLGAVGVANLPLDKEKFVTSVMNLAKDYEVWIRILDLVRRREEIGDRIKRLNKDLHEIVNEINNEKYQVVLDCCPRNKSY